MEKNGAQDDFFQAFFDPMRAFFQKTSKENRAQRQWMGGLHLIIIWKPDTAYPVAQRPALYFYFSFSNRNKPNFAKNIRIFRISSVRAYFTVGPHIAMSCLHGLVRWRASVAAAEFSSHVIPTLACAAAWDLWLRPIIVIRLIMKTRHCISGCGRVVL